MKKSRLYELISSLSEKEFFDLEPYLNHFTKARQKCKILYSCFKESYIINENNWEKACPTKKTVLDKVFDKKVKNRNSSLAVLSNELCDYINNYFAFLMYQQNDKDLLVQQYFFERNMFKAFRRHKKEIDKKIKTCIGSESTYKRVQLLGFNIDFENKHYSSKPNLNFDNLYYAFKEYVYVKQLKIYCIMLNDATIINKEANASIQKEMFRLINANTLAKFKDHSIIQLYQTCSKMLMKEAGQYETLKKILDNQKLPIEIEDHKTIRNAMLTYCNSMMHQPTNKRMYYREEHLLNYFYMYENNLLNTGDYLGVMDLKNICSLAVIRTKESGRLHLSEEKVDKLIEESYTKVVPKHQQSTYCFNLGVWFFYKKQYADAIEILNTSNTYANAFFTFDSRTILLRCHYALSNFDAIEQKVAAAKEALRRERQLSTRHKTEYRNFFVFVEKLSRIKAEQKYKYRPSIQQKLLHLENSVTEKPCKLRAWLLNEIKLLQVK